MKKINFYCLICLVIMFACSQEAQNIIVRTSQKQLPVLTGKDANEVLKITVIRKDNLPVSIKKLNVSTLGTTNLGDLESVSVYYTASNKQFSPETAFANPMPPAEELTFEGEQMLEDDTSYFWVSYKLKNEANLFNSVDATCSAAITSSGSATVESDSSSDYHNPTARCGGSAT